MKFSDCNISKFQYFKGTLIYIRCHRYVIISYNIFVWLNDRDVTKAMSTRIWTGLKPHFFFFQMRVDGAFKISGERF